MASSMNRNVNFVFGEEKKKLHHEHPGWVLTHFAVQERAAEQGIIFRIRTPGQGIIFVKSAPRQGVYGVHMVIFDSETSL